MLAKSHNFQLHSQLDLIQIKEPNPNLTIGQAFKQMVFQYGEQQMLGSRNGLAGESNITDNYEYNSFQQVDQYVQTLANYFKQYINTSDRVAVFSKNCPMIWITELAIQYIEGISVSLYDTLGEDNIKYCLQLTQCKVVLVGESQKQIIENILPFLDQKPIIINIIDLEQYILTNKHSFDYQPAKTADNTSNILFSSGTSGKPKAVLLTSRNMIAGGANMGYRFLDYEGVMLSYLPLAHVFEKNFEFLFMTRGGSIAFASKGTKNLVEDIKASNVTLLIGVPRVWQKIYNSVRTKSGPIWPLLVFFMYIKLLIMHLFPKLEKTGKSPIDFLFKPISKNFPKLTFVVSGSSAMSTPLRVFLQTCFCARLGTGYGLTETAGNALYICGTMKYWDENTLGYSTINTEVKLIQDDTGCFDLSSTKTGEICVKSDSVAEFYILNNFENKISQLDDNGFYHTGDIGKLNPDGSISFVRRKNLVIKLQQGEFVDLEKVEKAIEQIEGVEHAFVTAESVDCAPVCVVLVEVEIPNLMVKIDQVVRKSGLKGFCVPKGYKQVVGCDWLENRALFTPSAKKIHNGFAGYFSKDVLELRKESESGEKSEVWGKKVLCGLAVCFVLLAVKLH